MSDVKLPYLPTREQLLAYVKNPANIPDDVGIFYKNWHIANGCKEFLEDMLEEQHDNCLHECLVLALQSSDHALHEFIWAVWRCRTYEVFESIDARQRAGQKPFAEDTE